MCWMDSHNAILCCGFLCTLLISFYFTANTPRAITPRATTPHPYNHGLSRLCIHPGYHTRAITLNHTRTSGYHTRHSSSYFVVFISPAFTPPLLLLLHHHRAPHATTYSTAKRTATSTRTTRTRQNNPYRLGWAPAGVIGARGRCCPAATVPVPVVIARVFCCCIAQKSKKKKQKKNNTRYLRSTLN